jgi:hypothetical protein
MKCIVLDAYTINTNHVKIFSNNLRSSGDVLKYIVLYKPEEKLRGNKMCLVEHYKDQPIDYRFYVERLRYLIQIRMFKVAYNRIPKYISYNRGSRFKRIYLNEPLDLILKYLSTHDSVAELNDEIYKEVILSKRELSNYLPNYIVNSYDKYGIM